MKINYYLLLFVLNLINI